MKKILALFALALLAWAAIVSPANAVMATWTPGPLPSSFHSIQHRWEIGHMLVASLKLLGFAATSLSVLLSRRTTTT